VLTLCCVDVVLFLVVVIGCCLLLLVVVVTNPLVLQVFVLTTSFLFANIKKHNKL